MMEKTDQQLSDISNELAALLTNHNLDTHEEAIVCANLYAQALITYAKGCASSIPIREVIEEKIEYAKELAILVALQSKSH